MPNPNRTPAVFVQPAQKDVPHHVTLDQTAFVYRMGPFLKQATRRGGNTERNKFLDAFFKVWFSRWPETQQEDEDPGFLEYRIEVIKKRVMRDFVFASMGSSVPKEPWEIELASQQAQAEGKNDGAPSTRKVELDKLAETRSADRPVRRIPRCRTHLATDSVSTRANVEAGESSKVLITHGPAKSGGLDGSTGPAATAIPISTTVEKSVPVSPIDHENHIPESSGSRKRKAVPNAERGLIVMPGSDKFIILDDSEEEYCGPDRPATRRMKTAEFERELAEYRKKKKTQLQAKANALKVKPVQINDVFS